MEDKSNMLVYQRVQLFSWLYWMFASWQTAAQVTRETLSAHDIQADVVVTDLVHGLDKRLAGSVDVLLFNPPYVPTPEHEVYMLVNQNPSICEMTSSNFIQN